jgi:hypothetical protein
LGNTGKIIEMAKMPRTVKNREENDNNFER